MGKRGRRPNPNARRNRTDRAGRRGEIDHGSAMIRYQRAMLTGSPDLPLDPLGVLLGRGLIDLRQYHAGRDYGELLESVRAGLYGTAGSVQGSWLAILQGGAIRGRGVEIARASLWALRTVQRIQARLGDPAIVRVTTMVCAGQWVDLVVAAALSRPFHQGMGWNLERLKRGLEEVSRVWSPNRTLDSTGRPINRAR